MALEGLSLPGVSAWGLAAGAGMFAAGAFASNFFDAGVTLKSAYGWAKRNKTKDVTCHLGRHILYRLWSNESEQKLVEIIRGEVHLRDTLSGLKFSYTPPGRADKTISGTFTVNSGRLILKCHDEGFMAILCCSGENGHDRKAGVLSGILINNSPYAAHVVMVSDGIYVSDECARTMLENEPTLIVPPDTYQKTFAVLSGAAGELRPTGTA